MKCLTSGGFEGEGWQKTMALWTSAEGYSLPYLVVAFLLVAELAVSLGLLLRLSHPPRCPGGGHHHGDRPHLVHGGTTFEAVEFFGLVSGWTLRC